jgi:hypothetical protein
MELIFAEDFYVAEKPSPSERFVAGYLRKIAHYLQF